MPTHNTSAGKKERVLQRKSRPAGAFRRWKADRTRRRIKAGITITLLVGGVLLVLGMIYTFNPANTTSTSAGQTGAYPFVVGDPAPGAQAPAIRLQGTDGRLFDLAALRGKTVLLFFQEGLSCEPCWSQIKDLEAHRAEFQALGIETMVSITTDPLDALQQKVADEKITTPVLSDPTMTVSQEYQANQYGMMNGSSDGHSFILVGPDGRITWRADYGGAPNYTMYVPIPTLLANMKEGLHE
jgi:peroxiredoxin Q/BCP